MSNIVRSDLPHSLQWAVYTSYFWFGFSGLCVNEFEGNDLLFYLLFVYSFVDISDKPYGIAVLKDMGMDGVNKFAALGYFYTKFIN
ncbi:hypothetical protein M1146_04495 [Patescibacteria group bacterium]|nr:hypothetical protein [Patescibacteria group bacterium]